MGRPKHLVLVIEPQIDRLSAYVFSLLTHGYRVVGVHTIEQAEKAVAENPIDSAFIIGSSVSDLKIKQSADATKMECCLGVPIATGKDMAEALMRLKTSVYRKRGPKKGAKLQPASSPPVVLAHA